MPDPMSEERREAGRNNFASPSMLVHSMSRADDWETPADLFAKLDAEFGFTIDVAATAENAKCPLFFTPDDDGLSQSWDGRVCWMNPPYGTAIARWMRKAFEESLRGATVVCLVPARTDTAWWHDYAMRAHERRFLRGRVRFLRNGVGIGDRSKGSQSSPFPSAVVVFRASRTAFRGSSHGR